MQSFAIPPASSVLAPSILICEDSAVVRIYVKRTLMSAFPEAKIHEASDGKAGLDVMKANKVDLIVTDLQMEGMDGDSFLRLIKRNAVLGKKPVVVLSGMITEEIRAEYASRPEVVFLAKPATAEQLGAAVNAAMGVAL
jgi:CheY-like chemotaxis protein